MTALPRISSAEASIPHGLRAFVVVEDDDTRSRFTDVLNEFGSEIVEDSGGVSDMIDALGRGVSSPPLLIVDLENSSDPLADIDALADVCEPGTSVIAVGRQNDVGLFRNMVAMGVSDYLIKPVTHDDARSAVAHALRPPESRQEKDLAKPARVAVMIGARGGAGASTLLLNTAWLIAQRPDQKVALVDLDLYFGTATFALDLEPGRGLRDALENPDRVDSLFISSVAVPAHERLHIFGAEEPLDGGFSIDPGALDLLLSELQRSFKTVLVDLPRHLVTTSGELFAYADVVYVVSDLSLAGMRDTMRLLSAIKHAASGTEIRVVINRAGQRDPVSRAEFEKGIDHKIDLIVPDDAKSVVTANNAGRPLVVAAKSSKVIGALGQLAEQIVGAPPKQAKASFLQRLMKKK